MKQIEELYSQSADFKRYVDKYCNDYGYTTQEALEHALVREVAKNITPVRKPWAMTISSRSWKSF